MLRQVPSTTRSRSGSSPFAESGASSLPAPTASAAENCAAAPGTVYARLQKGHVPALPGAADGSGAPQFGQSWLTADVIAAPRPKWRGRSWGDLYRNPCATYTASTALRSFQKNGAECAPVSSPCHSVCRHSSKSTADPHAAIAWPERRLDLDPQ